MSPVARQKRLQSVWSPKTLIGLSLRSASSVRPPQMPASGVRRAKADQPVDGGVEHDGVGVEQQQVFAARLARRDVVGLGEAVVLRARDQPQFGKASGGKAAAIAAAEPSGEALSSRITSCGTEVSAASEARQSSVIARVL